MSETTITKHETVKKEKTILVCDSCGTKETELPEEYEIHTVYENVDVCHIGYSNSEDRVAERWIQRGMDQVEAAVTADESHLCGICYGAVFK